MSKLDAAEPYNWARALRDAEDVTVASPLWEFPPEARLAVLHERRVRFGVPSADDFDPEYH
ncbi:hypothetical protein HOV11_gp27 [Streptomyces phage Vash]|uniref:Uncharacterized protein n=1 Tax=Streptomyces phage Vash TaxID=2510568 RepID=A0A411AYU4_9CAUD|nr:hypothetical protein HOV11_gp27 [Streptomyces phage Vash]QAX93283.1 hypothetical protein SEA_VASH_27 [Streptomyces phage Vash]